MSGSSGRYVDLYDLIKLVESKGVKVIKTNEVTSLTPPADVPPGYDKTKRIARQGFQLTDEEVEEALNTLVRRYPCVDKVWVDPPIPDQRLFTFSFVPSSKAVPDEKGMYGVFKVRGVHPNDNDAISKAESLIRNVDSYHPIYHGLVGRAHPLVPDPEKFTREADEVDIKAHVGSLINETVKAARDKEQKEIADGNKRQKDYLTGESKEQDDNKEIDRYTELQVKRANLIFAILDLYNNIRKFKKSLRETISSIEVHDAKYPHYKKDYLHRYQKACEEAGIPATDNTIIKYMVGPPPFSVNDLDEERRLAPPDNEKNKKKGVSYFDSDVYAPRTAVENKHLVEGVDLDRMGLLNKESERARLKMEEDDKKKIEASEREILEKTSEENGGLIPPPCVSKGDSNSVSTSVSE